MKTLVMSSVFGLILAGCGSSGGMSSTKSITGSDYHGSKYYFGFAHVGSDDPRMMKNEVSYDVRHTHDIFTKSVGGDYHGTTLVGEDFDANDVRSTWKTLNSQIKPNDMFLQYSSTHGFQGGLGINIDASSEDGQILRYAEARDEVLGLPVKEAVVFTMACYSGGLVDSFNAKKDVWSNYQSQGKTLFVMASSQDDETSSTGPGTDDDEPNGPNGSAGSAYGHALWKALIGYADGATDGQKDGNITLGEIIKYVVRETSPYGQTPAYTGSYDPNLVIAKVPSRSDVERMMGDTAEGQARIAQLVEDRVLRD